MSEESKQKPPVPVFLAMTIVMFFLALSAADSIGFVPYYIDGTDPDGLRGEVQAAVQTTSPDDSFLASKPEQITISSINLDLPVQNPETRDIATLDEVLKTGPARYVDSAKLGTDGNVLIFAHSSHLPVVHNQMYRAFNRISELRSGDTITLRGEDGSSYIYGVERVRTADANEEIIDLSPTSGRKLTLVTCDTLTGKSSRYIVSASLIATL